MDSNPTRIRRKKEWLKNKKAFKEIMGDPESPDQEGVYNSLKKYSAIGSIEGKFGEAPGTVYNEKPSLLDFFCDVDLIISQVIDNSLVKERFYLTYIAGDFENPFALDRHLKNKLEQQLGKKFIERGISPIKRYFTITRKRDGK